MKHKKRKKQGPRIGELEEYLKANRKASRLEELEKNGWKWTSKHKIHKNKKKYDRKGSPKDWDSIFFFFNKESVLKTNDNDLSFNKRKRKKKWNSTTTQSRKDSTLELTPGTSLT